MALFEIFSEFQSQETIDEVCKNNNEEMALKILLELGNAQEKVIDFFKKFYGKKL